MIHTPGPWVYVFEPDGYRHQILSDNSQVAQVFSSDSSEADGLLIAAAPDLLEALLAVLHDCEDLDMVSSNQPGRSKGPWLMATEAIAKATGSGS